MQAVACRCQWLVKRAAHTSSNKLHKVLSLHLDGQVTLNRRPLQQPTLLLYWNLGKQVTLGGRNLQQPTLLLYGLLDNPVTLSEKHIQHPGLLLYWHLDMQWTLSKRHIQQRTLLLYRLLDNPVTLEETHMQQPTRLLCREELPGSRKQTGQSRQHAPQRMPLHLHPKSSSRKQPSTRTPAAKPCHWRRMPCLLQQHQLRSTLPLKAACLLSPQ